MMIALEPFPWQQELWRHLQAYIEQQRIPQALLLSGGAGLGKRHLADAYAGLLLCRTLAANRQACGQCASCTLLEAGTHPDYLCIEPDEAGKVIGIDKIRQLIVKLALKPQYEGYRVVIIQPADRLNTASANAFLKCLEEPTERTCLILISDQPSRLPATIRSRCQKINCELPDAKLAVAWLKAQGVNQDAEQLLKMSQGAPLLAKHYAERQFSQLRPDYFKLWLQIANGKTNLLTVAEQWQKPDSIELSVLLTWLSSWIKDIVKLAHSIDDNEIENADFKKPLQALAERLKLKSLFQYYDTVLRSRSQVTTQINKQLLLERLLIEWSQLNEE